MNDSNAWGLARFSDSKYLDQRFDAEELLRQRFIERGGKPHLKNPIYFFLGRHLEFERKESNVGYSINLKDLDPHKISFTYGDSMFCFIEEIRRQAGEKYANPLCTELYSVETLSELFGHNKFPKVDPLHVEAQLWVEPVPEIVTRIER